MKTDPAMEKAVLELTKLQYATKASTEGRAVGAFCREVLLPLMTSHASSNAYKLARQSLLNRGRNAAITTQSQHE